jgi:hypothetical protein
MRGSPVSKHESRVHAGRKEQKKPTNSRRYQQELVGFQRLTVAS